MTKAQLTALGLAACKTKRVTPATSDMITIGKDVLELLSSAMYVDPLTIYREYVQNAADAIDEIRANGGWRRTSAARSRSPHRSARAFD